MFPQKTRLAIQEVIATTVVTTAIALGAFFALRVVFPDPPLGPSSCPSGPAFAVQECMLAGDYAYDRRQDHRFATGMAVLLVVAASLLAIERSGRLRSVRLPLALAGGAGIAALNAALVAVDGHHGSRVVVLAAVAGLSALAALAVREREGSKRPPWWQYAGGAFAGVLVFMAAFTVWFFVYYEEQ